MAGRPRTAPIPPTTPRLRVGTAGSRTSRLVLRGRYPATPATVVLRPPVRNRGGPPLPIPVAGGRLRLILVMTGHRRVVRDGVVPRRPVPSRGGPPLPILVMSGRLGLILAVTGRPTAAVTGGRTGPRRRIPGLAGQRRKVRGRAGQERKTRSRVGRRTRASSRVGRPRWVRNPTGLGRQAGTSGARRPSGQNRVQWTVIRASTHRLAGLGPRPPGSWSVPDAPARKSASRCRWSKPGRINSHRTKHAAGRRPRSGAAAASSRPARSARRPAHSPLTPGRLPYRQPSARSRVRRPCPGRIPRHRLPPRDQGAGPVAPRDEGSPLRRWRGPSRLRSWPERRS
jgi:hypothetical protein